MSICVCPTISETEYEGLVKALLNSHGIEEWNLLTLKDIYKSGNTLESIPFRKHQCPRTRKCCAECTRRCPYRCIQDCLNRMYMWRQSFNQPNSRAPEALKLMVNNKFESAEDLAIAVGDILSVSTNPQLKRYIEINNISSRNHPYKMSYEQDYRYDERGRRVVNKDTGEIYLRKWPESGLCPYSIPKIMIDRRYRKEVIK